LVFLGGLTGGEGQKVRTEGEDQKVKVRRKIKNEG